MQIEIEAKFLDINPPKLRKRIGELGGKLIHPERRMRRNNFDYPDRRLEKVGGWIRIRDEGDKTTMAYKQVVDRTIEGTKEISLTVQDFDTISNLLLSIGMDRKSYQETKRERWDLNGVEVTIDTWPWIPTFVELEGASEEILKETAKLLGIDWSKALHGSVENAYQAYYNVTDEDVNSWENMLFSEVPDWLEIRRK